MTKDDAMFFKSIIEGLKAKLKKIEKHCKAEVRINEDEHFHFSKMTDGTEGICEGRLEFAEGVLNIINKK